MGPPRPRPAWALLSQPLGASSEDPYPAPYLFRDGGRPARDRRRADRRPRPLSSGAPRAQSRVGIAQRPLRPPRRAPRGESGRSTARQVATGLGPSVDARFQTRGQTLHRSILFTLVIVCRYLELKVFALKKKGSSVWKSIRKFP